MTETQLVSPHYQQHLIHHPLPLNTVSSHTACAQDEDEETASECEQEPDHYSDTEESFELLTFLPTNTSATNMSVLYCDSHSAPLLSYLFSLYLLALMTED